MYRPAGLGGNRNYLSFLSGFVIRTGRQLSEFELDIELHAAWRLGCDRFAEEWG